MVHFGLKWVEIDKDSVCFFKSYLKKNGIYSDNRTKNKSSNLKYNSDEQQ